MKYVPATWDTQKTSTRKGESVTVAPFDTTLVEAEQLPEIEKYPWYGNAVFYTIAFSLLMLLGGISATGYCAYQFFTAINSIPSQ